MLSNMKSHSRKNLSVLHFDGGLKIIFEENSISIVFKTNRNIIEILPPSLYTKHKNVKKSCHEKLRKV